MLRWFVFTLAMGLLPFGFSALLQTLRGVPPAEWQNSPELLFFSVMVCASQLGGIFETLSQGQVIGRLRKTLLNFGFGFYLIAAILASRAVRRVHRPRAKRTQVPRDERFVHLRRAGTCIGVPRLAGFSDESL